MPTQNKSSLELVYLNGQEHGAPPKFNDVRLSKESHELCEDIIQRAQKYDQPIRNEGEMDQTNKVYHELDSLSIELQTLQKDERAPWTRITNQITAAISIFTNQVTGLKSALRSRMERWAAVQQQGKENARLKLETKAEEKRQEAKYASDPKQKRLAKVEAEQYQEEARATKSTPVKGIDTVETYEFEITNRQLAVARNAPEAIELVINERWFKDRIRQAKLDKQPMPSFPGIKIITGTKIRIH